MSQRALDGLLEDFHEMCMIQKSVLTEDIKKCLSELKCASVVVSAVDKVIERSYVASPFDGLHTVYLQQQYFQKHFHFVVSSAHIIHLHWLYICTRKVYKNMAYNYNVCINLGACTTTARPSQQSCYNWKQFPY